MNDREVVYSTAWTPKDEVEEMERQELEKQSKLDEQEDAYYNQPHHWHSDWLDND